jgi:hypothetical protein
VSARPNPFEAARAFDNSEVTAWSPWQAVEPGMYLKEDFDAATPVDQLLVLGGVDQGSAKLRADGLGADGQWRTLATNPEMSIHLSPPGLRQAAVEDLKSLGFDYIVIGSREDPGRDILRYPSFWRMTLLRDTGDACVFRLN